MKYTVDEFKRKFLTKKQIKKSDKLIKSILSKPFKNSIGNIEFAYYGDRGNVLLVLTGIDGTLNGYEDKYVKLANKVLEETDFSVVIATTPPGSWEHTKQNLNIIMQNVLAHYNGHIYAMGVSAGGNILLMHAFEFGSFINKVLAVNPVLNINIDKIDAGINAFKAETILVCGENDSSSLYCQALKSTPKIIKLQNVDHNFSDRIDEFVDLPMRYFRVSLNNK